MHQLISSIFRNARLKCDVFPHFIPYSQAWEFSFIPGMLHLKFGGNFLSYTAVLRVCYEAALYLFII